MARNLVCNKGINDAEYTIQEGSTFCPYYLVWANMIKRCYSKTYQRRQPTYRDCEVCEEWLTFSNFKIWMEEQNWVGKELDKDILVPGNRVYSPETCIFVDKRLNTFLTERQNFRGEYPIGVDLHKASGLYRARCNDLQSRRVLLGYFPDPATAHAAWLAFKLQQAKILASQQEDSRVAAALVQRYEGYANPRGDLLHDAPLERN